VTGAEGLRARFTSALGFELDRFQSQSLDAIDEGRSVLVAAPTGSGKTVVAEYAILKALDEGRKAFYTTPLKALSNQKYADLARSHGRVGLLTGDNSIDGEAPVVVMTTEVLRNMIYAGSPTLAGLRYVILDEVHYLQDPYRGAVWEEVIVHAPPHVDLVCLSATVSNAEEFADWIETVRGSTAAVIEERRPVRLEQLYLVGDRSAERIHVLPTFVDGHPNPEAAALDAPRLRPRAPRGARRRLYTPRRVEILESLLERSMLPAIYFIFSRAACDDAVAACLAQGVRLTTPEERDRIRAVAESKVESLSDEDLSVLRYGSWLAGLEAGVAAHHAGLIPPFKEAVEICFASSLVKVVFATETLSLGINMPARTVVIERLSKFTGEHHEPLTPGEYTQLTGRAGRRGIDRVGYGVTLWSPYMPFEAVAGLASTRSYELRSSFRPTYNMAANLVRRYSPERARHLLNLSFAQYRGDAEVVRLESELERVEASIERLYGQVACERGDVEEYVRLERGLAPRTAPAAPAGRGARQEVREASERLRPGDVLYSPGGGAGDRLAVIATSRRKRGELRVTAVSATGRKLALSPADFALPPLAATRIELPVPYNPASTRFLRAVATALRRADLARGAPETRLAGAGSGRPRRGPGTGGQGPPAASHPVAGCPDLGSHLRALRRVERLRSDAQRLRRGIEGHAESLARQFDRVLELLGAWGYLEGWQLTPAGERLARIYHECDLLVAQSLERGLLDGLDAPGLAGLVSTFSFESRRADLPHPARFPTKALERRWRQVEDLSAELSSSEKRLGLPPSRPPEPGFLASAHAWAAGRDLDEVLGEEEMSGGDFVRNVKQLADLLRQVAEVAPEPATSRAAAAAVDGLLRGVVAASSQLGWGEEDPLEEPAGERAGG
jgi:ATP-dependent RNA helicase HelY